jgi:hypothetical protein
LTPLSDTILYLPDQAVDVDSEEDTKMMGPASDIRSNVLLVFCCVSAVRPLNFMYGSESDSEFFLLSGMPKCNGIDKAKTAKEKREGT